MKIVAENFFGLFWLTGFLARVVPALIVVGIVDAWRFAFNLHTWVSK